MKSLLSRIRLMGYVSLIVVGSFGMLSGGKDARREQPATLRVEVVKQLGQLLNAKTRIEAADAKEALFTELDAQDLGTLKVHSVVPSCVEFLLKNARLLV